MKEFIVENEIILIDFLKLKLSNLSKNSIKNLLHNKYIYVNDKCVSQYDYLLKSKDKIVIKTTNVLDILYEDKNIIVINKPSGLLTISTDKEKEKTAYHIVSEYVKKNNKNNRIFIIHRLDKDTSGIVMFAKNDKTKKLYQDNWNSIVINRCYYAVIDGIVKNKNGIIESYLTENINHIVHSTKNKKEGKLAITEYKVLKEKNNRSLLDINIKTGRKNQIRVHMKENLYPILGDNKYSKKDINVKRLYLHAYKLELINPINNNKICFETKIPKEFEMFEK